MRRVLFLSVSLPLVVVVGVLGRYGTVSPCGILSHTLKMQLIRATLAQPETGTKEELDAKLATHLALPMIARHQGKVALDVHQGALSCVGERRRGVPASSRPSGDIPVIRHRHPTGNLGHDQNLLTVNYETPFKSQNAQKAAEKKQSSDERRMR